MFELLELSTGGLHCPGFVPRPFANVRKNLPHRLFIRDSRSSWFIKADVKTQPAKETI